MGWLDNLLGDDSATFGAALMAAGAPKPVRGDFGSALMQAMQAVQAQRQGREDRAAAAEDRALRRQVQQAQLERQALEMEQAREQAAQRAKVDQWRQSIPSPQMNAASQALAGGGGPTVENAARMPQVTPLQQLLHSGMQAGGVSVGDYLSSLQAPKPEYKVVGGSLVKVGPGGVSEAYRAPDAPDDFSRALRAAGLAPDSPQARAFALERVRKMSTHQPGTQVTVNAEKPLINELAGGLGKQIDSSLAAARSAQTSIVNAHGIRAALDSGKVISGPGTKFKVFGLRLGQALGAGGKDAAEMLVNTGNVVRSMAQAELDAATQMRGQGQITEAEREIIRRAASGSIDDMTEPEIRALVDATEKVARLKISNHVRNVESLRKMPSAAQLMPFYDVDQPPDYAASAGAGGGRVVQFGSLK